MDSNEYKLGTEIRLSLETDYETRVKAGDLNVGFDPYRSIWELVIIYTGNLETVAQEVGFRYIQLLNNYAVVYIHESNIRRLTDYFEILYIDQPKRMYFEQIEVNAGCRQSCMNVDFTDSFGYDKALTGKGVLVAILDSGIDFRNPLFINEDGTSKVLFFWDQSVAGNAPVPYGFGSEINTFEGAPINDFSGHGTAVAAIVASCAKEASFLVVKLNQDDRNTTCKTTSLICAIDYAIRKAQLLNMPLVINISYGNDYGDHAGNSILERYIDAVSLYSKLNIVVGTGNDGNTERHERLYTESDRRYESRFVVDSFETAIHLQIWYDFLDEVLISVITPNGVILGPFSKYQPVAEYSLPDMKILAVAGFPSQINEKQELYIAFVPNNTYISAGIYTVIVQTQRITNGTVDMWLPIASATNTNVSFLTPNPEITLTIPSTAQSVISVGAYDSRTGRYANFSGRGFDANGRVKPDISAPGVQIQVKQTDGSYQYVTGTSFATPYVSAGVALLMQWGIVEQKDPFLYGQKIKSYLRKGAKPFTGEFTVPNSKTGYGAICVENSLNL